MAEHLDHSVVSEAGLVDGGEFTITVNSDTADRISIFVDDGSGNPPASYDYDISVAYNDSDSNSYMPRNSVSGSTSTHHLFKDVSPFNWKLTFTNSSGTSNDYRVRVVVIEE